MINPEYNAKRLAFHSADDRWHNELVACFGKDACNARYVKRGEGKPGTTLYDAHQARESARLAFWQVISDQSLPSYWLRS